MNDHKQYFIHEMEIYFQGQHFTEDEKRRYVKKVLRDKVYKQKLLCTKSENAVIEIGVLQEMLEEVK